MPLGKRHQRDTTSYALIVFVGLFVIALVAGVIYYIKAESYKTETAQFKTIADELATASQRSKLGALVGEKDHQKSRLGTMLDYIDQLVLLATGQPAEDTSAQIKADATMQKAKDISEAVAKTHPDLALENANTALIPLIKKLNAKLENTNTLLQSTQKQLEEVQTRFDDAMATGFEKEQRLLAEKGEYEQLVNEVQKNYNQLKVTMEKTSEKQVKDLMGQLENERDARKKLNQQMLKTQAELKIAEDRMKRAQKKLESIVPPPDSEVAAFEPDGQIILIDNSTKVVHLNIGSKDRVYRGLTFSVYDKNIPIPKDGKGKAEIEVFNVDTDISAARIISSEAKNPIIINDIAANLIWDSSQTNTFVVAGEFDLNGDSRIEKDAVRKINALITKWGGKADNTISVDTDFLILGHDPVIPPKPTFEQIAVDPMAMEKYEAAVKQLEQYKQIKAQAEVFSIPILNGERFLYFIGYKTQSARPGAF